MERGQMLRAHVGYLTYACSFLTPTGCGEIAILADRVTIRNDPITRKHTTWQPSRGRNVLIAFDDTAPVWRRCILVP